MDDVVWVDKWGHATALSQLGEQGCVLAISVARDLRNGTIEEHDYDQRYVDHCGTGCCIFGHMKLRGYDETFQGDVTRMNLFAAYPFWGLTSHPSQL
jgi:hypothetical protein